MRGIASVKLRKCISLWLNEIKGCLSTYKGLRLPYNDRKVEIDVAGGKIIRGEKKFYHFDKIIIFLVKIKTNIVSMERLFGQLLVYSKSVNDLAFFYLPEYGKRLVGPDELYVYACVPEIAQIKKEILEETHMGLLFYSISQQGDILINEIVKPHNLSKYNTSKNVKQNLAIFDKLCKEHPLYSKIFPSGRKHLQ